MQGHWKAFSSDAIDFISCAKPIVYFLMVFASHGYIILDPSLVRHYHCILKNASPITDPQIFLRRLDADVMALDNGDGRGFPIKIFLGVICLG